MRGWWRVTGICLALAAASGRAQETERSAAEPIPVDVQATRLEFDQERNLVLAIGDAVVTHGRDRLTADYLEYNTVTHDIMARGNVVLVRGGQIWRGQTARYNVRTRLSDVEGDSTLYIDPLHIRAGSSQQISPTTYVLRDVTLTTCAGDDPEYHIRARRATLVREDYLRAEHVTFHLGGVPVFYVPRYTDNFGRETGIDVVPGYSSRLGAFLLASTSYRISRGLRGTTHLDYRTKRGLGTGQDLFWHDDVENRWRGRFRAYYADDQRPIRNDREAEVREGLVDSDRYRLSFAHTHAVDPRTTLYANLTYLSDPFFLEDFFRNEFRRGAQPENRVHLVRQGDVYTLGLLASFRLNDFYGNVNRLPELLFEVPQLPVGETGFYYRTENSLAWLERVFPKGDARSDYDAVRGDSRHRLEYPTRQFGFLSVVPRAGYRGTYYSRTLRQVEREETVPVTDDDGAPVLDPDTGAPLTETVMRTEIEEGSGDVRHLHELGVEMSFQAFRMLRHDQTRLGQGLRHIAEPYLDYTYVPTPNLRPADLPQFDGVDRLDRRNDVRLGMRHYLQTRVVQPTPAQRRRDEALEAYRVGDEDAGMLMLDPERARPEIPEGEVAPGYVRDLVRMDVFTTYRLSPEPGQEDFSDLFFRVQTRLSERLRWDFDGAFDMYESEVSEFNTQLHALADNATRLGLEYRYRRDQRDLLGAELDLIPLARWSLLSRFRYNVDTSDLEEQEYIIRRQTDCIGVGLGFRETRDDWRVYVQLWLQARPQSMVKVGR